MSRRSSNRNIQLQRAKNKDTAHEYVAILAASKHKQHQRAVPMLQGQLEQLSNDMIAQLKKKEESNEFAKTIMAGSPKNEGIIQGNKGIIVGVH